MSLDSAYTDVNVDQRNEENFDRSYHQGNARVGYVSKLGLSGFLQGSFNDGESDSNPFNSTTEPGRR
ncbi:MAG: hypothetical protein ABIU05_21520 [Nitrospirales bacterium]